jgi:2-C-methyl-D-erythritol 4-phosphate cytidylyltransferase
MKKIAIIVAGGSGSRMGSQLPKQFILLREKPVLYYTLKAFLDAYADMQVILVLPGDYIEMGREIIDAWFDPERIQITEGGDTRFQSVRNGLQLVQEEAIIFVHDGVRCMLSQDLIHRCYQTALETGTAVPAIASKDSVRILTSEENEAVDRNQVRLIQTPQTFHSKILLPAFQIDYKDKFTDEATVVEAFGIKITLVEGEEANIKLTLPVDMVLAEKLMGERESSAD